MAEPGRAESREALAEALETQRENLATLRVHEAERDRLRAREAAVEAESLAAAVAVKAGLARGRPDLAPAKASAVVSALAQLRAAEGKPARTPALYERAHLEAGIGALSDWLSAGERETETGSGRTEAVLRLIVLGLLLAVLWAAVSVHLAFLLLVPPIVVPFSLLVRSGDDTRWRRMGARRHFDKTNLAPPASWDEASVRARRAELENVVARLRKRTAAPERVAEPELGLEEPATGEDDDEVEPAVQLHALLAELRIPGGVSGQDLAPDMADWLETLARAHRARHELEALTAARGQAEAAAGEAREAVFRFLARRGEAPAQGGAQADALEAGLRRVEDAGG